MKNKSYKTSSSQSVDSPLLAIGSVKELIEAMAAIQIGVFLDTPIPISLLKSLCSHTQFHNVYFRAGVKHYKIDNKTCVRLSEFVKAREQRNAANK